MLGADALLASFLNRSEPVLEGVHVAWRAASALQSSHFVCSLCLDIRSMITVFLWQSNDRAEKFSCFLLQLDTARGLQILGSARNSIFVMLIDRRKKSAQGGPETLSTGIIAIA